MDYNKEGLIEIPKRQITSHCDTTWTFSKGSLRNAVTNIFSKNKSYVLFQTIANKEAADELLKYLKVRKDHNRSWSLKKAMENESSVSTHPSSFDNKKRLHFSYDLIETYRRAIDKMSNQFIGENNFSHYPLVNTQGVREMSADAIYWPEVYLVDEKKYSKLIKIIDELNKNSQQEVLKYVEGQWKYNTPEINALKKSKISPIIRLEDELKLSAKDLIKYVNFFGQMTEVETYQNYSIEDD